MSKVIPTKGTDALLADHKMIRKLLADLKLDNPRFPQILQTTHRVVAGHAWFEDEIFLPAVEKSPLLARHFTDEIYREHEDINALLGLLRKTPLDDRPALEGYLLQFRSIIQTHFAKEEDALFPMAERILDNEGLNRLGAEMRLRAHEGPTKIE